MAPSSSPDTLSATSPRAERKITALWRVSACDLMMRHTSKPFMPGIITSSRIRSGLALRAISRAVAPSRAARMRWPLPWSVCTSTLRLVALSSTTRMVDGGAIMTVAASVDIRGHPFRERGRELAHAVEVEIRDQAGDAASERGVSVVSSGQLVGNHREVADGANGGRFEQPRRDRGVPLGPAEGDLSGDGRSVVSPHEREVHVLLECGE